MRIGGMRNVLVSVSLALSMLFSLTSCSTPVSGARVNSDFQTLELYGISGRFGIVMEYTPQEILTRPSKVIAFSYSPGSLPVSVNVNILEVLAGGGYHMSSTTKALIEYAASLVGVTDPWNATLPLMDTPIGRYLVQSFEIYPGLPIFIDLTLDGQVNATLSATSGQLDKTSVKWSNWGGNEVNLTVPSSTGTSTVTASFRYFVSASISVRFTLSVFTYTLTPFSFPLGELQFQQSAQSTVEVVDTSAQGVASECTSISTTSWILIVVAIVIGLVIGIVIGRITHRKSKVAATPPPGWSPPPPG